MSTQPQAQPDHEALVADLARAGRAAQRVLARLRDEDKAAALRSAAASLRAATAGILEANARDIAEGQVNGLSPAMLDRLRLDEARLEGIAAAVEQVAALPDQVGRVIDRSVAPSGLELSRVRVPIGLIGIIYESRPNVTADAAALCLRSGNAALLRGGSEAVHSNRAIHAALAQGLEAAGVPAAAVQLMPTQDREAVGAMLRAAGLIDMIVPRGGKGLVARVQNDARVPVLAHLDGICHTYVHSAAEPAMAVSLAASANDWDTEYLEAILSVAVVDGLDAALAHVARHSSGHTDAIVTADGEVAERFLAEVDSAIVMVNASTQFADGGEFGLGAEIGIATGRLHARGPVALEGLTTYKWQVRGHGETRP